MRTHLTNSTPDSTTDSTTDSPVVLHSDYAADLADLLGCLREWIDTEHHQLDPLLAKHNHDINGLRIALDLYTSLLRSADDQPPF
jgi:hypothetical protein